MKTFVITPHRGIGPVRLGMSRAEVRSALRPARPKNVNGSDHFYRSALVAHYEKGTERCNSLSAARSDGLGFRYLSSKGLALFQTPASEVVKALRKQTPYDSKDPELGYTYTFPKLDLACWRPVMGKDGRFFDTVTLGVRGYFDTEANFDSGGSEGGVPVADGPRWTVLMRDDFTTADLEALAEKLNKRGKGNLELTMVGDVSDEGFEALRGSPFIASLSASVFARVGARGMKAIASLPNLTELSLTYTKLTAPALKPLARCQKLEELDFSNTRFGDAALAYVGGLTRLRSLTLNNTPVTGEGLRAIRGLTELRELHLSWTKVDDAGLGYIAELENLEQLSLIQSLMTDKGLQSLWGLKRLKKINLTGSKGLTPAGIQRLKAKLPKLKII
jgi:hypothetical protein